MATVSGRTFAETIFSDSWLSYLSSYGIDTFPSDWFYRTMTQAYDACDADEKAVLISSLIKQKANTLTYQRQQVPKKHQTLFDRILEPYFLQKLSVFTAKEILTDYITFQNERVVDYAENQKLFSFTSTLPDDQIYSNSLTSIERIIIEEPEQKNENDGSIIDITGEGQTIDVEKEIIAVQNTISSTYSSYYDENWKLGNKYRDKLNLSDAEVTSLNKFWDPSNSFLSVEQCCIAVIKLYLLGLDHLLLQFTVNGNDFYKEFKKFTTQNQSLRGEYTSVQTFKEQMETYVHLTFFRRAESAVREAYKHKRKINTAFSLYNLSAGFERRFGDVWNSIMGANKESILATDHPTEVQLNRMNVTRWKFFFEDITATITNENTEVSALRIDGLAEQNNENPAVENIYFEACKLFAKQDKIVAVRFYLKYVYADLQSDKTDSRQLGKTIQKNLFLIDEQLRDFEAIVNGLVKDKNLEAALLRVPDIYGKKRKKIHLDLASVEQAKTQHQNTVDKLSQWLQEEDDNYTEPDETVELKIAKPDTVKQVTDTDIFTATVLLSDQQKDLLLLFSKNKFQLEEEALNSYARSKSLFKNQLMESINDCCYEELDDLLIEETSGGYMINEFYYNKIINLC